MGVDLRNVEHRPWPLPCRPWVMAMRWEHLLFMHWPVDAAALQAAMPAGLELDVFDGSAWLGVVPFVMAGVRLRGTPPAPVLSRFAELNLRTYVTVDGRPGVFFFSLDCASGSAVRLARLLWGLPYFHARMSAERDAAGDVHYVSTRADGRAPRALFAGRYRPSGPPQVSRPGSIEYFLTERYCLYTAKGGAVRRGEIHHQPWPLQPAMCDVAALDMTRLVNLPLPDVPPLLHFARRLDVVAWLPT